ncbi:FecCD family ABC transporter permease [Streptococcus sp. DD12]|uniref:FecCD family ABC transporter permease n=1 Tax=Streptococcus sp. DD12 TaxID=1777880 RepID=UPI00079BA194|nr:iron ABC transporter permease [Streptococcus sp. DD12]KXT75829.1 Ferrichrome transport system permease protein FhuG [Streptococcus sp. DD12]
MTSKAKKIKLSFLICLCLLAAYGALAVGDSSQDLTLPLAVLTGQADSASVFILTEIRLPRLLVTLVVGCALAVAGKLLQTLTRNPLADAGVLGINAGAGLAITLVVAFADSSLIATQALMVLAALAGGLAIISLIFLLAKEKGRPLNPTRFIITGVGLATLISGLMIALMAGLNDNQTSLVTNWLSGQITGDNWTSLAVFSPLIGILLDLAYCRSQALNILALPEETAQGLGLHLHRERLYALFLAAGLTAISVVLVGNVSFIGLLAGHLSQRIFGQDHRWTLPASALIGLLFFSLADSLDRLFLVGTNIPTGLVIAVIGAPYFLWLMSQSKT